MIIEEDVHAFREGCLMLFYDGVGPARGSRLLGRRGSPKLLELQLDRFTFHILPFLWHTIASNYRSYRT